MGQSFCHQGFTKAWPKAKPRTKPWAKPGGLVVKAYIEKLSADFFSEGVPTTARRHRTGDRYKRRSTSSFLSVTKASSVIYSIAQATHDPTSPMPSACFAGSCPDLPRRCMMKHCARAWLPLLHARTWFALRQERQAVGRAQSDSD